MRRTNNFWIRDCGSNAGLLFVLRIRRIKSKLWWWWSWRNLKIIWKRRSEWSGNTKIDSKRLIYWTTLRETANQSRFISPPFFVSLMYYKNFIRPTHCRTEAISGISSATSLFRSVSSFPPIINSKNWSNIDCSNLFECICVWKFEQVGQRFCIVLDCRINC